VDCVFCAILAGRSDAALVAETDHAVALVDPRRAHAGHVLVIPRRHVERFHQLDDSDAVAMMRLAVRVARALELAFAPAGLSLWQSNGEAAGQEVPHVHLHLMPRAAGDGLLRIYPGDGPPVAEAWSARDAVARRFRAAIDGAEGAMAEPSPD